VSFASYSQVGQDLFAYEQIGETGTFLDLGSNDPVEMSNSYALEQHGWRGLAIDIDPVMVERFRNRRTTPVLLGDATQQDWKRICAQHQLGSVIDYLSLDLDGQEFVVLKNLLAAELAFRVITCEHDRYQRGDRARTLSRELLQSHGYTLTRADVMDDGLEFEDWWTR